MPFTRRQFLGLVGLAGLSSCARNPVARIKPHIPLMDDRPVAFAAINDTHVLDARSVAIVNRAVASINANPDVRFTVVLGDLATDGLLPELQLAKASLARLEKPCFAVPGNHDVNAGAADIYGNYARTFGDSNWRQEEEGWVFIGLDTCNGTASDVTVPAERVAWIEKRLRRIGEKRPIALFTHHPFNPNTKAYRVANADDVLACFAGHNLRLVASGHYHGNQVEERDGVTFTTTACCSTTRDNFDGTKEKGYRLFRLDGETLTHEFVPVQANGGMA